MTWQADVVSATLRVLGRQLQIGDTDLTSAARTPSRRLRIIPKLARASFLPPALVTPIVRAGENDLTRRTSNGPRAAGEIILIQGRVVDAAGRPQPRTLIEIWNANTFGRYDHPDDPAREPLDPWFAGEGRAVTDSEGRFSFVTIRPAPYLARPDINRWRPAHIHLSLVGGAIRLVTQMYFPADLLLEADPSFKLLGLAGSDHIGRPFAVSIDGINAGFLFDIVVAGARETWLTPELL